MRPAAPRLQDRYQPPVVNDPTREHAATVAQGFPNAAHRLTITSEDGRAAAIRAIRIYRPPLE